MKNINEEDKDTFNRMVGQNLKFLKFSDIMLFKCTCFLIVKNLKFLKFSDIMLFKCTCFLIVKNLKFLKFSDIMLFKCTCFLIVKNLTLINSYEFVFNKTILDNLMYKYHYKNDNLL
ncbi:hypothetical protein P3W45_000467 [Vairimorpha bombi]